MEIKNLINQLYKRLLLICISVLFIIGILWMLQVQNIYGREREHIQNHMKTQAEIQAKTRVSEINNDVLYQKNSVLNKLKSTVKARVYEGYDQCIAIYEKNKTTMDQEEIKKEIKQTLEGQRFFDGRGYYFIDTLEGDVVMDPLRPEVEGTNIYDLKDLRGQEVIKREISIVQNGNEGYTAGYWVKPNESGDASLKISFVKRIEPFSWYIGAGEYYEDLREMGKKEIIDQYQNYYKDPPWDGHVFIYDQNGNQLIDRFRFDKNISEKKNIDLSKADIPKIVEEEVGISETHPEGYSFVRDYITLKGETMQKVVYIKSLPEWGWIIGAEVSLVPQMNNESWTMDDINEKLLESILHIIFMIFAVGALIAYLMVRQMVRLNKQHSGFIEAFRKGVVNNEMLDLDFIVQPSFRGLGQMVNRMIEARKTTEEKLKQLNEVLEKRVEERTKDLQNSLALLQESQEQNVRKQRLSIIGSMATGLTHEINEPILLIQDLNTLIINNSNALDEILEMEPVKKSDLEKRIKDIIESSMGINQTVEKILQLVKGFKALAVDQSSGEKKIFKLKANIEEVIENVKNRIKPNVPVIELMCDEEIAIESYPTAINQIITNLMINSVIHGFQNEVGRILIEVIQGDNRVLIRYQDDGRGIQEEYHKHIYDPFFTTARSKGGSGLGLNVVHQLVTEKLGGSINFSNRAPRGVLFEIEIPETIE